jgi:S1-C subfamily serine protease
MEKHMPKSSTSRLADCSVELAELVAKCSRSVVAVGLQGRGSVSGILWRAGYVVTAAEALADEAASLPVWSDPVNEVQASVVGRDPSTDVALLRVAGLAGEELPDADLAALRPGQLMITLGRSPEHGTIVGFGAVAVAGAPWQSQLGGRIDRFIRLGMALSQAAEGGAVLNAEGRLVGMAVHGPRRALLVIPAPTIGRVVEQLLAKGRVSRGYLGIALQPVQLPEALHGATGTRVGLLVSNVDGESGAGRAGVLLGDVVVALNAEPLRDYRQVQRSLGPESVGSTLKLGVVRGGVLTELHVTVGERPASE